jgi:hypothetical protein
MHLSLHLLTINTFLRMGYFGLAAGNVIFEPWVDATNEDAIELAR